MVTQVLYKKLADSITKNHDNVFDCTDLYYCSITEFMYCVVRHWRTTRYASSIVILETPELCALFHAGDQKSLQFIQF